MPGILFAVITVIVWGNWLAPSQTIPFKNQQIKTFYVAVSNLVLAFFVGLFQGFKGLTPRTFWFPFTGGIIWAVSGYFTFVGTNRIGIARAIGIWALLNIIVSILRGLLLPVYPGGVILFRLEFLPTLQTKSIQLERILLINIIRII